MIGANGKLTGYGGGLSMKEKLLALERNQLRFCECSRYHTESKIQPR